RRSSPVRRSVPFASMAILQSYLVTIYVLPDTATTDIHTLSLHDALPISADRADAVEPLMRGVQRALARNAALDASVAAAFNPGRSEEHTSELQSHLKLVCRLLLEKKK